MTELWERDAWQLADGVRAGELKAVDLLEQFLARIERFNEELNAFCFLDVDGARASATGIDAAVARGEDPGVWTGVPMGVKELVAVEGWPDTHASMLYENNIADHTATEAARLRAAGAVLVGLTTSPEYGSLNWTRTYIHGVTRNPWNTERTPGGSSGGSAATVAVGMMPICTGSDGGGSIRTPSSYSGLFGFKISFGRVGDSGRFDVSLLSVPGPICRSVRDAARYVDAIAGPTDLDPTSLPKPPSYEEALLSGAAARRLRGLRAAWSSTLGYALCEPDVEKRAHEAAIALCEDAGIELVDADFHFPRPGQAWSILTNLDVSANHLERFQANRDADVTPVSRAEFEQMERLTSEQLFLAQQRRWDLLRAIADVFDEVDLILTPTAATTAFKAEGPPPREIGGQPIGGMGSVPFSAPFNIAGMPAVSIPVGAGADGMPVGMQVVARRHEEELVLACGAIAEAERPWPKFAPMAYT